MAHLAGDDAAADEVQLVLPETGVCSSSNALSDDELALQSLRRGSAGPPRQQQCAPLAADRPARLRDRRANGRAEDVETAELPLIEVRDERASACCG